MSKYAKPIGYFKYRCRACNETFAGCTMPLKAAGLAFCALARDPDAFDLPARVFAPHHHKDGSIGLGDLIGVAITDPDVNRG